VLAGETPMASMTAIECEVSGRYVVDVNISVGLKNGDG
jgi:hypothetical protein